MRSKFRVLHVFVHNETFLNDVLSVRYDMTATGVRRCGWGLARVPKRACGWAGGRMGVKCEESQVGFF